jgi:hypothetical protein
MFERDRSKVSLESRRPRRGISNRIEPLQSMLRPKATGVDLAHDSLPSEWRNRGRLPKGELYAHKASIQVRLEHFTRPARLASSKPNLSGPDKPTTSKVRNRPATAGNSAVVAGAQLLYAHKPWPNGQRRSYFLSHDENLIIADVKFRSLEIRESITWQQKSSRLRSRRAGSEKAR